MSRKKDNNIQIIRAICISAVILIHILYENIGDYEKINNIFNILIRTMINFAVPIFIFISGYLVNIEKYKDNYKQNIKNRLKRLYLPFIIWSLFYSILSGKIEINSFFNIVKTIFKIVLGINSAHLYYIIVLIFLNIITPFLINIINKKVKKLIILYSLITVLFICFNFIINCLNVNGKIISLYKYIPFVWSLYYFIGLYYRINKSKIDNIKVSNKWIFLILFLNFTINIIEYKFMNYSYVTSQIKITNMLYVLFIIYIFKNIYDYINIHQINYLVKIGDNSYGIYYIHLFWVLIFSKIQSYVSLNYYCYIFISFILTLLLSMLSIKLVKKILKEKSQIIGF